MAVSWCWACDEPAHDDRHCDECGAPPWATTDGPGGVYLVEAACGLVKIGVSRQVDGRLYALAADARQVGQRLRRLTVLWGADGVVEAWLHRTFADLRDRSEARATGLPAPTEWFWPSPALWRLADDGPFMRVGMPWEEAAGL